MTIVRVILALGLATVAGIGGPPSPAGSLRDQAAGSALAVLHDSTTIENTAIHGQTHRYEVFLAEGDFFDVAVTQEEILATLSVSGSDDRALHSINLPDIDPQRERLMFIAPVSGRYVIDIRFQRLVTTRRAGVAVRLDQTAQSAPLKYLAVRAGSPPCVVQRSRAHSGF